MFQWTAWTPYNKDPALKKSFDGSGNGATCAWEGSQKFVVKVMDLFFGVDKIVGKDFEVELGRFKPFAEK